MGRSGESLPERERLQRRTCRSPEEIGSRQRIYGAAMSYTVIFVQFLTGLFYTPIILKTLGQSEYGIYSLSVSCISFLTIFDGGMNAAFVRFYVQTKENESRKIPALNGMFLKIFAALSVLAMIAGLLFSVFAQKIFGSNIRPDEYPILQRCLYLLTADAVIMVVNTVFTSLITANEEFVFGKVVNLFSAVLTPALTVPMLLNGHGAVVVMLIRLLVAGLTFLFNGIFCIKALKVQFDLRKGDGILLKNVLLFAGAIAAQAVMDQLNWQIDKWILGRVRGTGEISVYSVGSSLNQYYIILAGALSGVFIAKINRLAAQGNMAELNRLFQRTSRILAFFVFWIMTSYIFFGKSFIRCWAGAEYGDSYYVGLLIMLPVTASLTQGLGQDIARAKNRHKLQIIINLIVCSLNMLISIPLASLFGAVGSAFGSFVAEILICIVIQAFYYQKIVGLDMRAYFVEMLRIMKGLAIPVLFGGFLFKTGCVRAHYAFIVMFGLLYTGIYGISMWLLAVNEGEKAWIRGAVSGLFRKTGDGR